MKQMSREQQVVTIPLYRPSEGSVGECEAVPLVWIRDEASSESLSCAHPQGMSGVLLGAHLLAEAKRRGRGRVLVMCDGKVARGLHQFGFVREAMLMGFYEGVRDCHVMVAYPDVERSLLHDPDVPVQMEYLQRSLCRVDPPPVPTRLAEARDARRIQRRELDEAGRESQLVNHGSADEERSGARLVRLAEHEDEVLAWARAAFDETTRVADVIDCVA